MIDRKEQGLYDPLVNPHTSPEVMKARKEALKTKLKERDSSILEIGKIKWVPLVEGPDLNFFKKTTLEFRAKNLAEFLRRTGLGGELIELRKYSLSDSGLPTDDFDSFDPEKFFNHEQKRFSRRKLN